MKQANPQKMACPSEDTTLIIEGLMVWPDDPNPDEANEAHVAKGESCHTR